MEFEFKTERIKGVCSVKDCENKAKGTLCGTHASQKSRAKDLVKYAFHCKRNRAKQRGIFWDLTLEEFRKFCHETDYMNVKGKMIGSYDVDRREEGPTPGYTYSNIQLLEKVANIKKYKKYDAETKKAQIVIEFITPPENLPF